MKVDPEQLEAEAQEALAQMKGETQEPKEEDTPEAEPEVEAKVTEEPEDTTQEPAQEQAPVEETGGEVSESELALQKADQRYKNAQRKMTEATTLAKEQGREIERLRAEMGDMKRQLVEKDVDLEQLKSIREEYPDLAAPILDHIDRTQAQVAETNKELEQLREMRAQEEQRHLVDAHFQRIKDVHPDVSEITQTGDWTDWLESQDGATKSWIESGSSNDVNSVLSRFKQEMGLGKPTPQERVLEKAKAAAEPKLPKSRKPDTGAGQKVWSAADIKGMSLNDFEANEEALLQAWRSGQIRR